MKMKMKMTIIMTKMMMRDGDDCNGGDGGGLKSTLRRRISID